MNYKAILAVVCIFLVDWKVASAEALTNVQIGQKTAEDMRRLYSLTPLDCGSSVRPAFLCSGIVLRGTNYSDRYRSWDPSPNSVQSGGVSASFIRKDAKFSRLASDQRNGFTLLPIFPLSNDKEKLQILCSFPIDAGTDVRNDAGCGTLKADPSAGASCQSKGAFTAGQWYENFLQVGGNRSIQCGFDVRSSSDGMSASAFIESLRAMKYTEEQNFNSQLASNNELRIATWPAGLTQRFPIQSFFYHITGIEAARKDQRAFYAASGRFVPVIALTLPASASHDAGFDYRPADQAQLDDLTCGRYIKSASWSKYLESATGRWESRLSVVPTDCGRAIGSSQTDSEYAELISSFGRDTEWTNADKGGMRRQMVCHLKMFRMADSWTLEPFRPNVSDQESLSRSCDAT